MKEKILNLILTINNFFCAFAILFLISTLSEISNILKDTEKVIILIFIILNIISSFYSDSKIKKLEDQLKVYTAKN